MDIELNVRGICCLKTGPRPNGKVIRVVSIVDRYLEHARIFFSTTAATTSFSSPARTG